MSSFGPAHPLDVDLADLVDGIVDDARAAQLEAHLADCLLCRIKRQRLRAAPPVPVATTATVTASTFPVPTVETARDPAPAELWLSGSGTRTGERLLVLVVRLHDDRVLVAPVTFDVGAADDETVVVDAQHSPLDTPLAVYPTLATELPRDLLAGRVGTFTTTDVLLGAGAGLSKGTAITGPTDPRLEVRQYLADRLGSLEELLPDPLTGADAPVTHAGHVRSALMSDLRAWRGNACAVRPVYDWGDLVAAEGNGWVPLAAIDEVGVVLVVFDTPHGLVDDRDFDAARAVLTRFNGTALVVLAATISDLADVFDSSALNYGFDMPSGAWTPPRPLIAGLTPFDAISKFLDRCTGVRALAAPSRGPIARLDVGAVLRDAASAAVADAARQGARFKIAPKRRGYESVGAAGDAVGSALRQAFTEGSVVEELLELARRQDT